MPAHNVQGLWGPRRRRDEAEVNKKSQRHPMPPSVGLRADAAWTRIAIRWRGQRQGDQLSRARRAIEHGRRICFVPGLGLEGPGRFKSAVLLANRAARSWGEPAWAHRRRRALLHRDQPLPHPRRGSLHRQRTVARGRHYLAEMRPTRSKGIVFRGARRGPMFS